MKVKRFEEIERFNKHERFEKKFSRNTIAICICIAEEYGRIATLKEDGIEDEEINYEFISYQFERLHPYVERPSINSWDQLQDAYVGFLDEFY